MATSPAASETSSSNDIAEGLVDLLWHLDPLMRSPAGVNLNADAMLLYLSEADPHFNRFAFRRHIRSVVESALKNDIETRLARPGAVPSIKSPEEIVAEELLQSPQFHRLKTSLTKKVDKSCKALAKALNSIPPLEKNFPVVQKRQQDAFDSSFVSALEQSSLFSVPQDEYAKISRSLSSMNPSSVRAEALSILFTIQTSDILSSKEWPVIRNEVQNCALTGDDVLFEHCLKFHLKLLATQDSGTLKEGYLSLLEIMAKYFNFFEREGTNRFWTRGIDFKENSGLERVFKLASVVNNFQKAAPVSWLRLPNAHVVEMIDNTMDLLSYESDWQVNLLQNRKFEPVVVFACVDPGAIFVKQWLRGTFQQRLIKGKLTHSEAFVTQLVKFVLNIPKMSFPSERFGIPGRNNSDKQEDPIAPSTIASFLLSFAVNFCAELCRCRIVRDAVFPVDVSISGKRVSLNAGDVVASMIRFATCIPPSSFAVKEVQEEMTRIVSSLCLCSVQTLKLVMYGGNSASNCISVLVEVMSKKKPKSVHNFRNLAAILRSATYYKAYLDSVSEDAFRLVCSLCRESMLNKSLVSENPEAICDLIDACVSVLALEKRSWALVKLDRAFVECQRSLDRIFIGAQPKDPRKERLEAKLKFGMLAWSKVIGTKSAKN